MKTVHIKNASRANCLNKINVFEEKLDYCYFDIFRSYCLEADQCTQVKVIHNL